MRARLTAAGGLTGHRRPDRRSPESWRGRCGLPGLPGRPEVGGSDGLPDGGSAVGDGLLAVGVGVGSWLGPVSGGVYAGVDGPSDGVGAGEEPAGVSVGELVGTGSGHVGPSVFVWYGWVGVAELAVGEAAAAACAADAVPEASGTTLAWLGSASATTGSTVETHPALDAECVAGAGDCPGTAAEPAWPPGPPPAGVAPSAVGAPPSPACVPSPSVPTLSRAAPPPPSSEVLAWRIAWRTGWTPSMTPASSATPATAVKGRSHPMSRRGNLLRRDRRSQNALSLAGESRQAQ
jgi:hypothetical protein